MSLSLALSGQLEAQFWDSLNQFDKVSRQKTLFSEKMELLSGVELHSEQGFPSLEGLFVGWIDLPFEIPMPLHDPITQGFGPCSQVFLAFLIAAYHQEPLANSF